MKLNMLGDYPTPATRTENQDTLYNNIKTFLKTLHTQSRTILTPTKFENVGRHG